MAGSDAHNPGSPTPEACPFAPVSDLKNVVLCDTPLSRKAHQELFNLPEQSYIVLPSTGGFSSLIGFLSDLARLRAPSDHGSADDGADYFRVQMALTWESLLKVVRWSDTVPTIAEIVIELGRAGLSSEELKRFRTADPAELFPWLYYGKRFEVFRKLCHAAKRQAETRLKESGTRFLCHLVDTETGRLLASSL